MEEKTQPEQEEEKAKSLLQMEKERWYDKLPLNLKQLDTIIIVCWILIFLTPLSPPSELQEIPVAIREQSGVLCFHSR